MKGSLAVVGVAIFLVVVFSGFLFFRPEIGSIVTPSPSAKPSSFETPSRTFIPSPTVYSTPLPTLLPSPTLISAPSPNAIDIVGQAEIIEYALSLINSDRQTHGLQNVTLSSVDSGQIHADDMLLNHYVSHWDTSGYKPYMRYTLAGGEGAVAENVAWQRKTGNIDPIDAKSALKDLEYAMMYDDASSNWGHRDNILDPSHNKVSIGVAYDNHNVYLVQDFEDDYVVWSQRIVDNNQVTLDGTIQKEALIQGVAILYDNPSNLTVAQINEPQYQDGYGPGTYVAMAMPPNWRAAGEAITITAENWRQNENTFEITFTLSPVVATIGNGVYTLYLVTGSSTADSLTTYSVWIR